MDARRGIRRLEDESGVGMVIVLVALVALLGLSALAIDVGMVWASRTQLQGAVDAAALAAAADMIDLNPDAVNIPNGDAAAMSLAGLNKAVPTTSVVVDSAGIEYGLWDTTTRTLDTAVDLTDPDQVTGVQVTGRLDGTLNSPLPAVMARVLGINSFDVGAVATAYLGYAGSIGPGEIELPIATDCCALMGSQCDQPYCGTDGATPPVPSPCEGDPTMTCLIFSPTQSQSGCWTVFKDDSPSINTPGLTDIIDNGYQGDISVTDYAYLDNGDKTPVIRAIADKFYGDGNFAGNPQGHDYYPIFDGVSDSWVTPIAVSECQDVDHCAGGAPAKIEGFVCMEIREVLVTPEKMLKVRFLCPSDPLYQTYCGIGPTGSGGANFGIRATIPVLVR